MHPVRLSELLKPFLGTAEDRGLTINDLEKISTYVDLLIRWNAKINLTAVRRPEEIATRHFGESLFAASHLFPAKTVWGQSPPVAQADRSSAITRLIDLGSGAGFPGLPIKIWAPGLNVTLIESNQKKATFLREVTRKLTLTNVNIFSGRAENFSGPPAEVVTLRAVERFDNALPTAADLVTPGGRLALLIGEGQIARAHGLTPTFSWKDPVPVPLSSNRALVVGVRRP